MSRHIFNSKLVRSTRMSGRKDELMQRESVLGRWKSSSATRNGLIFNLYIVTYPAQGRCLLDSGTDIRFLVQGLQLEETAPEKRSYEPKRVNRLELTKRAQLHPSYYFLNRREWLTWEQKNHMNESLSRTVVFAIQLSVPYFSGS